MHASPQRAPRTIIAAAACTALLFIALTVASALQPDRAATPASPTPPPDTGAALRADLMANARLHREHSDQTRALFSAGRVPRSDAALAEIAALEAEVLLDTVRDDTESLKLHMERIVELHRETLDAVRAELLANPNAAPFMDPLDASRRLSEAQVRLWQATRPPR